MTLGLLQEAIIARERREAQAQPSSALHTYAPPRKVARRSQNSRYDRDLSNIVSFDPPPVKPVSSFPSTDPSQIPKPSNTLEKYRYRGAENAEPDVGVEDGVRGRKDEVRAPQGIWKKLNVPVKKEKPLDPALEDILWPKALPPPDHVYNLKTPSPPEAIIGQTRLYDQPYPTPSSYQRPSGYQPPPRAPVPNMPEQSWSYQTQSRSDAIPAFHRSQPIQRDTRAGTPSGPPDVSPAPFANTYYELHNTQGTSDVQYPVGYPRAYHQYQPQPASLSHPVYVSTDSRLSSSRHIASTEAARSHEPLARQGVDQPHQDRQDSHTENHSANFWRPDTGYTGQNVHRGNPPQVIYHAQPPAVITSQPVEMTPRQLPLSDPTIRPVPVFDDRLKQWVLVPRAPASPALTVHQSSDDLPSSSPYFHTGHKRPADSSSDRSIPRSLEVAFQNLDTPTRPRRVPSRDMHGKKSGRALIESLENQGESSESDEINIRSDPAHADQSMDHGGGRPYLTHNTTQHRHTKRDRSAPRSILRRPQISEEDDDMMGDEEEEQHSSPYRRRSTHSRSHKRMKKEHMRPSRKHNKHYQHRDGGVRHTTSRVHPVRVGHSNDQYVPRSTRSRVPHQHRQPSYSPSSTETAPTDDEASLTSPSDTPSSPSPAPDRRVPLTQGAWAGYDLPPSYHQNGSHPSHSRSRSRKVPSVPLPVHQRPRDAQGKWLPYANTRSESPEDTEMEVEDELELEADREDIEGFSSPSQEERYSGGRARQGLSPVIEVEEEEEEVSKASRSTGSGGKKKAVRWKEVLEEEEPVRMTKWKDTTAEFEEQEHRAGAEPGRDLPIAGSARLGVEGGGVTAEGSGEGRQDDVGAFGEGFFDSSGGEVGFTVWRDGY